MTFDADLDLLLEEALHQQILRRKPRKPESNPAADYARRLAEKALYRRLINESDIAQDGIRFVFWFGGPGRGDLSLCEWRKLIDREIERARNRNSSMLNSNSDSSPHHHSESEAQQQSSPAGQPPGR